MEAGFDHICSADYSEFESCVGYQMSAGYPAKNSYLAWSPATSDASQQSLIARQVMDIGLDHICSADYGEFESFLGYQITCIGPNVCWLFGQKTYA